jgi:hypothetical protein
MREFVYRANIFQLKVGAAINFHQPSRRSQCGSHSWSLPFLIKSIERRKRQRAPSAEKSTRWKIFVLSSPASIVHKIAECNQQQSCSSCEKSLRRSTFNCTPLVSFDAVGDNFPLSIKICRENTSSSSCSSFI